MEDEEERICVREGLSSRGGGRARFTSFPEDSMLVETVPRK